MSYDSDPMIQSNASPLARPYKTEDRGKGKNDGKGGSGKKAVLKKMVKAFKK